MRVRAGNVSSLGAPSNEVVVSVAVEREPTAPGSVTGRWVGLVANGNGVTGNPDPMCGIERFDWQLDLTQAGSVVTGTLTQTTVVSTCEPPGTVKVAPLTGTAGPGTFSFSIGPSRNVTATYTASRMTGSGGLRRYFCLDQTINLGGRRGRGVEPPILRPRFSPYRWSSSPSSFSQRRDPISVCGRRLPFCQS